MLKIAALLFISAFPPFNAAAAGPQFRLDSVNAADIQAVPAAPPQVAPAAVPAEWTVMLYSTTRDNLRYALAWQLLEMKRTGSTDKVKVVAQATLPFRRADGSISTDTVRLALGVPGGEAELDATIEAVFKSSGGPIDEKVLKAFEGDIVWRRPAGDTGDWRAATDFTAWAAANYPARRRVFVIYGHGNGFFDQKKQPLQKGTLMDTDTGNYVTLPELREVMRATGRVDAFIMTSCNIPAKSLKYYIDGYK